MEKETVDLKVKCDVKEAKEEVNHLVGLLKEASALVDELASKGITLKVNV